MNATKMNCERPCYCLGTPDPTRLIVLTGGPGAGKTAVLEVARKLFCTHVAILPEAASLLYGGGFWRLSSFSARQAAQRAIFHVQTEMEQLVINEAQWAAGLCDRGSIDGLAYWPGSEERYWEALKTTRDEQMKKYYAVLHLRCPSERLGYNLSNPLRVETAQQAARIDSRIAEVWRDHPRYHAIDSSASFVDKTDQAISLLLKMLPECCQRDFRRNSETGVAHFQMSEDNL